MDTIDKLVCMRESSFDKLRTAIAPNQGRYAGEQPWLGSFFGSSAWRFESDLVQAPQLVLKIPESKAAFTESDLENTRIVYAGLRHLSPLQAADPRLWAYLTHEAHWEYMRKRWPIEGDGKRDPLKFIQERYLFMPNLSRALIRNGIARLWWYGYCSYDAKRSDPFELTAVLLKNLDVTQSILERAFSLNRSVTQTVLEILLEREQMGRPFYLRYQVRELARYLVRVGGVTILDALDKAELRGLIAAKVEQLAAA